MEASAVRFSLFPLIEQKGSISSYDTFQYLQNIICNFLVLCNFEKFSRLKYVE